MDGVRLPHNCASFDQPNPNPLNIAIVGSGIIGLATARELLERGHRVRIFTKDRLEDITSSKAAAIWLPYLARPVDDVNRWSKVSYGKYRQLCQSPETGIRVVDITVLVREQEVWWKDAVPAEYLRAVPENELPKAAPYGYRLEAPLIETQVYLVYLQQQVTDRGGAIEYRAVENLETLLGDHDLVVNCSGLGAVELVGDTSMYPVKGQLLKVENQAGVTHTIADFAFDVKGEQLAYIIPRRDHLILGGTAIRGDWDTTPDPLLSQGIYERCKRISGSLRDAEIQRVEVGLRPGRPEIRVERNGSILHNYGHGGAGYTVCWGCARDVADLVG